MFTKSLDGTLEREYHVAICISVRRAAYDITISTTATGLSR